MVGADPPSARLEIFPFPGYNSTRSITAFPSRTPTLMAAVFSLRHLHCVTVGDCEADGTLVANEALLEFANKLDTP